MIPKYDIPPFALRRFFLKRALLTRTKEHMMALQTTGTFPQLTGKKTPKGGKKSGGKKCR